MVPPKLPLTFTTPTLGAVMKIGLPVVLMYALAVNELMLMADVIVLLSTRLKFNATDGAPGPMLTNPPAR